MIKLIKTKEGTVIGDIDMFFSGDGEAEVNIMIGDSEWRRHGYASEALTLAEQYAVQKLDVQKFIAKIGKNNTPSMRFFERHGYRVMAEEPNVFDELIYELDAGDVPRTDLSIKSPFEINV
jgi:RimJ/RimL family protein N-acetyltransferase